jgi:hypothetical protein
MKQRNMNWVIALIILVMNVLFITTGGLSAAMEVSSLFGVFMEAVLLAALTASSYFAIKKK